MKEALVIGRFQIVGNQHIELFKQIEKFHKKNPIKRLNVGIGVAGIVDFTNPFSGVECLEMIRPIADGYAKRMKIPVTFRLVPDINDPPNYAVYVSELFNFKEHVILFSSNEYTNNCFRGKNGFKVQKIHEYAGYHSTDIRKLFAQGIDISEFVPKYIPRYLNNHNARRRIEKLLYDNPIPTVDIVIKYNNNLVIIERKNEPFGLALPGGHIDYAESCEDAAIREAREETGLEIKIDKLIGVFSDPNRDPRGHRISVAYSAIGNGDLKAGSDAKKVLLSDYNVRGLLFDHDLILDKYMGE